MKSNVMHIYAEGTSLFAQRNLYDNKVEVALQKYWYDIIYCNMGIQIHNKIREIYYQNSKKKKVKFVKLNFPTIKRIDFTAVCRNLILYFSRRRFSAYGF